VYQFSKIVEISAPLQVFVVGANLINQS
jgi:hypothetical protein